MKSSISSRTSCLPSAFHFSLVDAIENKGLYPLYIFLHTLKSSDKGLNKSGSIEFVMEWKKWIGKNVFVQLRSGGFYTGKIIEVDDTSSNQLVWLVMLDKFGKEVQFVHSEIIKIVEEEK